MEWFRLYSDMVNNSKVMLMPEQYRWRYIALLCVSSEQKERGTIPDDEEVIFKLRITPDEWTDTLQIFLKRGLVEKGGGTCFVHGWHERQYASDDSKQRVQKYRRSNADVTLHDRYNNDEVTPPETDTEQIQNRTEKEQKEPAFFSPEHKATEQLKIISAEFNLDLEREIDRRPRAPDIVELVRIAREVFPIMIGTFTGFEAARHSLKWLRQSSWHSTKGFDRLEWLLDVRNRGQKASSNLRQYSGKEGDYARKMAALEAEYAINGSG